jgi:hypothetical protein
VGHEQLTVPSVGTKIAAGTTSSSATTIVLTTTAGAAVGAAVVVYCACSAGEPTSVVDSRGNTWVMVKTDASRSRLFGCQVTVALIAGDTITITTPSGQNTAFAIVLTDLAFNQVNAASAWAQASSPTSGTDSSVEFASLASKYKQDALMVACACSSNNPSRTFDSIDQSYTIFATQAAATPGIGYSICFAYKTVTATDPMPTQSPTITLNGAATLWFTIGLVQLSGVTDYGAKGKREGQGPASTSLVPTPGGATFVPLGARGRTADDGFPQPVNPIVVKRPVSREPDYALTSE